MTDRPCTCHSDDNPPSPCVRQYALDECRKAASQPVAWRVECRWVDRNIDQTWRKYSDCVSRCAAGTVRDRVANSGDMESRIVPLYAGTPEEPR